MARRWVLLLVVLLPVSVRAQTLIDTGAALATQSDLARTSASSASPMLDGVRRSLQTSTAAAASSGGWGQARGGGGTSAWATASSSARGGGSANGSCWASSRGNSSGGWATANKQGGATGGWARGGDRAVASVRR
jgi:hypothetical protein